MIDEARIKVASGKGGNGAISGRREKFVPMGGPDGGDGGAGGDIYIQADGNISTLLTFRNRSRFVAQDGKRGSGGRRHGRSGDHLTIRVPVGTRIVKADATGDVVGDMSIDRQLLMVARGGKGGRGNASFVSPTNRFPVLAEAGEPAEQLDLHLELKILADVGIIGAPNAGKSSLLAAVTRARPKIADYPFTTTEPAIGICEHRGEFFAVVDIPGLIEGAHAGVGLGHDFLRHAERAKVLLHVIDGALGDRHGEWRKINNELEQYGSELASKQQLVAINKIDVPGVKENAVELKRRLEDEGATVVTVSAVTGEGLTGLLDRVVSILVLWSEGQPAETPEDLPVVRPVLRERTKVSRVNGTFVVEMGSAARIAEMVDESNWQAWNQFMGQLRRMGVVKALEREGVVPGDTVRLGKHEWKWS